MNANTYTPGPWHVNGKHVRYRLPGFATSELLADCDTEANAALIAAAPELLEALTILYRETADYIRINHLGDVHHNRSMQFARDIIARAEGEAQLWSDCDIPNKCPFCGEHAFCVNARPRPELKQHQSELIYRIGEYQKWAEPLMENDFANEGDKIYAWEQFGAAKEFLESCIQQVKA